jgi:hypothetical protein
MNPEQRLVMMDCTDDRLIFWRIENLKDF